MIKITRSAARHIFFSISMIGRYRTEGRRKWYLFYALCDESYAMLSRDVSVLESPHAIPEAIALAVVSLTYFWKRNAIFSVVIGTALYMFLVQSVF